LNSEFARLSKDFGWSCDIESLEVTNAFLNPRWSNSNTTFSDAQSSMLDSASSSSWWFETRNLLIHKYVKSSPNMGYLWDIGSGPGVVSSYLQNHDIPCIAVEPSRGGVLASAKRGVPSIESDLESLQIPDASVGRIGLFDVLEHIELRDDFLREIWRVLSPDGSLILTVPALNWLWSAADEHAGHFIRYSQRSIRRELAKNGFKIQRSQYFFASLVLPLLLLRALPYRLKFKQPVNDETLLETNGGLLGKLVQHFEVRLSRFFSLGTSLIVVAQKA
jgi:ubiquinone/menaquinone biosynthesis C-methylase UbiE